MKNKILSVLKNSGGFVSGEQISSDLGISRTAVWKYIKKLRGEGYTIDSVTNKGYKLIYSPDILSSELISSDIGTEFFAKKVYCYDEIPSTNIAAKEHSDEADGTLFVSEVQTAGRGRLGREWKSPRGVGIWMSVLLKPDMDISDVSQITLAAGLAVCRALSAVCGVSAKIKWPNDVVIGTKKVCGILTEMSADIDGIKYVVPGIGINVNDESFDDSIASKATSLYIETGKRYNRCEIIQAVMREFERYYKLLISEGFVALRSEYRRMCVNIDREVFIMKKNEKIRAYCVDITRSGNLLVDIDGKAEEIHSGEVSVRGIYDYV